VVADLERAFSHKVKCLDGARACPPDDVGSISGYYNFCKSMKDKKHKERKSNIEWHGSLYDSEYISIDAINIKLIEYERWSRDRYLQSGS
ncbi:MAG: hypothetical protein KAH48_01895, partial [Chlorobi bacterium]|nr:hypothetical protein [Chlorobiota bacterium]